MNKNDLARRLEKLDRLVGDMEAKARCLVDALAHEREAPVLVAEKLWWGARMVQSELEELYKHGETGDIRICAALLLLDVGRDIGLPSLLNVLEEGEGELVITVSRNLARAGVKEAVPAMLDRLRREQHPWTVVALLNGLLQLKVPWPPEVRARWLEPDAPEEVRQYILSAPGRPAR